MYTFKQLITRLSENEKEINPSEFMYLKLLF